MLNVTSTGTSRLYSTPVIEQTLQVYQFTGALWLMSLCLLLYDILLTLDAEVKYFWKSRPGFVSCLFFLNRYWPAANLIFHNTVLSNNVNPSLCSLWFQYTGYSTSVEHLAVGGILIVRVYAMFNGDKKLLVALLTLYVLSITAETVIVGLTTYRIQDNSIIVIGCAPVDIPTWCWAYWVPSATFDSILLLLALWKTFRISRCATLQTPFLAMIMRDSFVYFVGVMSVTLANLLAWCIKPYPFYGTFVGLHICLQSILGCRLLLNIRETAAKTREFQRQDIEWSQWSSGELTTILLYR